MENTITYVHESAITDAFKSEALSAFRKYESDKASFISRVRDNDKFYREFYERNTENLKKEMDCSTPLLFSAIENACATSSENYPSPNIIERDPDGTKTAETLSKLIECELDHIGFKKIYKNNTRNKLKYGTAIYGVFYNDISGDIDIKSIDIFDVFVDMHLRDIQDSNFLFISQAVDNDILKRAYPEFKELFTGDAKIETITESCDLKDRSIVLDCYYKKPDCTLHMMKLCNDTVIYATEDSAGYEKGLYDHGLYPVVFDVLYPCEHSPFGFGMIDVGKATQIQIDKMDNAITENLMKTSNVRYFSRKNGGIDEKEFLDMGRAIVHYEGDVGAILPISGTAVNANYITYRESKKDELKELVANRDFQQGDASGGVVSGTAINLLQQSGEKRARSMMDDSYEAYRCIIVMAIELIRQFYSDERVIRSTDEYGKKTFIRFSNDLLMKSGLDAYGGVEWKPLLFDIDVVAQKENPFTREAQNSTLLALWQQGLFDPQKNQVAQIVLKHMNIDGKDKILSDLQELFEQNNPQPTPPPTPGTPMAAEEELVPVPLDGGGMPEEDLVPVPLDGGGMPELNNPEMIQQNPMPEEELVPIDLMGGL